MEHYGERGHLLSAMLRYKLGLDIFSSPVVYCSAVSLVKITANVLQLGEVADLGALTFNLALMFI